MSTRTHTKTLAGAMALSWATIVASPVSADLFEGWEDQTGEFIAAHQSGGVVVAGTFLGDIAIGGQVLSSPDKEKGFLARFDAGGQLAWADTYGSAVHDVGNFRTDIAIAADGTVAIVSYVSAQVELGGMLLGCDTSGPSSSYLAVLDPDGKLAWHRCENPGARAWAVAFDGASNIVMAGEGTRGLDFGGGDVMPEGMDRTGFVAAFDKTGNHLYSFAANGTAEEEFLIRYLTIADNGNLYLGGYDPGGVHVACMSTSGDVLWGQTSNEFGEIDSIATDSSDGLILGGDFRLHAFGFGDDLLPEPEGFLGADSYVAAFDANGTLQWLRGIGGAGDETLAGVGRLPGGDVMVVGTSDESFELPEGLLEIPGIRGQSSLFEIILDKDGLAEEFRALGDLHDQIAGDAATTSLGETYITGSFRGTLDLGGPPLYRSGRLDAFVGGHDVAGVHLWSEKMGEPDVVPVAISSFEARWWGQDIVFATTTPLLAIPSQRIWLDDGARRTALDLRATSPSPGVLEFVYVDAPTDGARYWLEVEIEGASHWFGPTEPEGSMARDVSLRATPNPSFGVQMVSFTVRQSELVTIDVFDLRGRRVRELLAREVRIGQHRVAWDGLDGQGTRVASGTYFIRLKTPDRAFTVRSLRLDHP